MMERRQRLVLLSYTTALALLMTSGVVAAPPASTVKSKVSLQACPVNKNDSPPATDTVGKSWRPLEKTTELDSIAAIATGNIFDGAGYGWRPGISYAFTKDGQVWNWGYHLEENDAPQKLAGIKDAKQVTSDYVLTGAGELWQISEKGLSIKLTGLEKIKSIQQIDAQEGLLFLLKEDGSVLKWENGAKEPQKVSKLSNIREIYSSAFSLFVIDEQGKLLFFNGNAGDLDNDDAQVIDIPGKVKQIAVENSDRALIQTEKGEMYLYDTDVNEKAIRAAHADGATRMAIVDGGLYLIVKADGSVWGWGHNILGMLGEDQENEVAELVKIPGLSDIIEVQTGTDHVLALDKKGYVYSFGSNMTGQLGRIPVSFDKWTELGELKDVKQAVTKLDQPYFVRKDGSVWGFGADRVPYEVKGPTKIIAVDRILDSPVTLNESGQVQVWSSDFGSCEVLSLPYRIKDFVGGEEHLLLRTEDDQFLTVKFSFDSAERGGVYVITKLQPEKVETLKIDAKLAADVTELYANHYTFFALTKNGQVLFAERRGEEPFTAFSLIPGLEGIRELAPEYFVRNTKDVDSVYAINDAGKVREIQVYPEYEKNKWGPIKVKLTDHTEDGIAKMSGRLRITKDGQIFEHDWKPFQKQKVPSPVRLVSSTYDYAIEGPGWHYHVLVTEDDKIVLIGDNPYGKGDNQPAKVQK